MGAESSTQNGYYPERDTIVQNNADLAEVPTKILEFPRTQRLALSQNRISSLPPSFSRLIYLRELDLSYNKLTEFPICLFQLTNLTRLDLHANQIKSLPEAIPQPIHIQEIDLSGNLIPAITPAFLRCVHIQVLNVSANRLIDLPFELSKLKELRVFDFHPNSMLNKTFLRFSEFLMNDKIRFVLLFLDYRQRNPLSPRFEEMRTERGRIYFQDHGVQTTMWDDPRYFEWVRSLPYGDVGRFDLRGDPFTQRVTVSTIPPQLLTGTVPEWVTASFQDSTGCKRPGCINETSFLCPYRLCNDCCTSPFCKYHLTLAAHAAPANPKTRKDEERIAAVYGKGFALRPFVERATLLRSALGGLREKEALPWHQRPRLVVHCSRATIMPDSFRDFARAPPDTLRNRLKVYFAGEQGRDYGGVSRDWFHLIMPAVCNPDIALFCESSPKSGLFTISTLSGINPEHLNYFHFVGQVLGKALSEEYLITTRFTQAMYKRILGIPLSISDLEQVDPELFNSLKFIEDEDPEPLCLTFSVVEDNMGEIIVHKLIENGDEVDVTEENKKEYIRRMVNFKLTHGTEEQMQALRNGFYQIVPPIAMKGFRAYELEQLLMGMKEIDMADWMKHTNYGNCVSPSTNNQVKWFWEIVNSMSNDDRSAVLRFATGSSAAPYGGFANLMANGKQRNFTLCLINGNADYLPVAHTCFNQIDLPAYKSKAQMESKLRTAINETGSIELI